MRAQVRLSTFLVTPLFATASWVGSRPSMRGRRALAEGTATRVVAGTDVTCWLEISLNWPALCPTPPTTIRWLSRHHRPATWSRTFLRISSCAPTKPTASTFACKLMTLSKLYKDSRFIVSLSLCRCCDFYACDCRMQCPHGCDCSHDESWSRNVITCSARNHTNVPLLVSVHQCLKIIISFIIT